jgi:hypothetical protein
MKLCNAKFGDAPPEKFRVNPYGFTAQDIRGFLLKIIAGSNERNIDLYLRQRLSLFAFSAKFFSSGNHGSWVVPQANIKPPGFEGKGLVPDYLFASQNSDGITWWVVELKSPGMQLYTQSKSGLVTESKDHSSGISQLRGYIEYCERHQAFIRDTLGLRTFTSPYGVFIGGRENELKTSPAKQEAKARFNRDSRILQIRTYDAYIRQIQYMIGLSSKVPGLDHLFVELSTSHEVSQFDYERGS